MLQCLTVKEDSRSRYVSRAVWLHFYILVILNILPNFVVQVCTVLGYPRNLDTLYESQIYSGMAPESVSLSIRKYWIYFTVPKKSADWAHVWAIISTLTATMYRRPGLWFDKE